MVKEVGTMKDDKFTFLNLSFSGNVNNGEVEIDVDLDKRIIKSEQTGELRTLISQFLKGLNKIMEKNK
ncbi:MAG: hypothetical protein IJV31_11500 [Clostridia bacterium]|nr:hypothetical protein [Clostridia bacterium]